MSEEGRQLWEYRSPTGARIQHIGPDEMIDPAQRRGHERELVSITAPEGYGMGVEPQEFDDLARAWVDHQDGPEPARVPLDRFTSIAGGIKYLSEEPHVLRLVSVEALRGLWTTVVKIRKQIEAEVKRRFDG